MADIHFLYNFQLLLQHTMLLLEDSVYHEFRYEGEPHPPLKALEEYGSVIHVSGFTKVLLPGMRIGYVIAQNQHLERIVRVKLAADISTPSLNQRAIYLMLQRGILAQQIERNNRELKRRRNAAMEAARLYFPQGTVWNVPQGGLYLWVRLPSDGPTSAELFVASLQRDVAFAIGNIFYTNGCGNHRLRLNFGMQKPEMIHEGFRRIGEAWRSLAHEYDEFQKAPLL